MNFNDTPCYYPRGESYNMALKGICSKVTYCKHRTYGLIQWTNYNSAVCIYNTIIVFGTMLPIHCYRQLLFSMISTCPDLVWLKRIFRSFKHNCFFIGKYVLLIQNQYKKGDYNRNGDICIFCIWWGCKRILTRVFT